jgi:mRNA-degrading endonuclease YafQ of YafQ-DinJ toxin-antitoxin module
MDQQTVIELLVNSSPLAAFAGYLVYQTRSLQARMDDLNVTAQKREDNLRSRYDKVISDLQDEKAQLQQHQQHQLIALEKKVDDLVISVDNVNNIVQDLRIKDLARNINNAG